MLDLIASSIFYSEQHVYIRFCWEKRGICHGVFSGIDFYGNRKCFPFFQMVRKFWWVPYSFAVRMCWCGLYSGAFDNLNPAQDLRIVHLLQPVHDHIMPLAICTAESIGFYANAFGVRIAYALSQPPAVLMLMVCWVSFNVMHSGAAWREWQWAENDRALFVAAHMAPVIKTNVMVKAYVTDVDVDVRSRMLRWTNVDCGYWHRCD